MTMNDAHKIAESYPNVTTSGGMSWCWAEGFNTEKEAEEFVVWLDTNGFDNRGVYAPCTGETNIGWSVRYRR